jgi:hypothetical protein
VCRDYQRGVLFRDAYWRFAPGPAGVFTHALTGVAGNHGAWSGRAARPRVLVPRWHQESTVSSKRSLLSSSLAPWGACACGAGGFFFPRGLLQAFSRYRFRLALLLRFKNTGGAGTHRTPVKRHRGEPGLTGSNSAVAPVVASVVLTFTRYTRSAVLVVGSFDWRNARV